MLNFTKTRKLLLATVAAGACFGATMTAANAATDGTVGATSTGTVVITAIVPNLVRITSLTDLNLGTWDGTNPMSGNDDACVWTTTGGYNITATGSGAANAFTLASGANTLAYTVEWDDAAGQTNGTALTSGTALTGQTSTATATTCAVSGLNTSVIVKIATAALGTAPAGTYTGTLTLVVAPE